MCGATRRAVVSWPKDGNYQMEHHVVERPTAGHFRRQTDFVWMENVELLIAMELIMKNRPPKLVLFLFRVNLKITFFFQFITSLLMRSRFWHLLWLLNWFIFIDPLSRFYFFLIYRTIYVWSSDSIVAFIGIEVKWEDDYEKYKCVGSLDAFDIMSFSMSH